jgi:phenylpropionate dioxygenase-like ring-hydroxylating dioxygenase large terminal subunit
VGPTPKEQFSHLVDDEFMDSLQDSIGAVEDGRYMHPHLYTSPEWFEFEKAAVYDRSWLCVGRADQIANVGDYFTITINQDPLMVVRGEDHQIRVMSSVCQHRGHLLAEDAGNKETGLFRCPLHHWSFDLEGKLKHAPEMRQTNDFARGDICLPQLKVELWQGFIFTSFEDDPEPLAPTLRQLEAEMENYDVANMISLPPIDLPGYPWNWKVMLENFMEPYHNAYLHKGIHDFALGHGFVEHDPDENVIMHPTGFDREFGAFNPIHKALLPPIPTLSEEQRSR